MKKYFKYVKVAQIGRNIVFWNCFSELQVLLNYEILNFFIRLAFHHFNESAYKASADGMFNLASLYLTGTGVQDENP
jgi:TPR repeat protein